MFSENLVNDYSSKTYSIKYLIFCDLNLIVKSNNETFIFQELRQFIVLKIEINNYLVFN